MYAFEFQRQWFEALSDVMSTVSCNTTEGKGPDGKTRSRVRQSFTASWLPDRKGRLIEMTPQHRLVILCLLAHIDDIEADASFTYVTVRTIAAWAGVGNTKAEGLIAQLRAVGIIARRKRTATSSVTTLYRTPGNWEQQAVDENLKDQSPSETEKTETQPEGSTSPQPVKPAPQSDLDKDTKEWMNETKKWLEAPDASRYDVATINCPPGSLGKSIAHANKQAADEAIALLKAILVGANRVARTILDNDRWIVVALLRPEIIASRELTKLYEREITVDRLPQQKGADAFRLSCTMMRLFTEGSPLNAKIMPSFHDGIANPAGWLVKSIPRIVAADASTKGFPFSLPKSESPADAGKEEEEEEEPEEPEDDLYEADRGAEGEEPGDEEEVDDTDDEPEYDKYGDIIPRYQF